MDHTYEEIRGAALDVLAGRESVSYEPTQYQSLHVGVAEVLARRDGASPRARSGVSPHLSRDDAETFLEVFWALFREGIITLGLNDSNREFPFFRLTTAGRAIASGDHAYFFHDVSTYKRVLHEAVPDLNDVTLIYLQEAMQAFKAACLLSATVMLGVAAEHTFVLTLEAAESAEPWASRFQNVRQQRSILRKISKFKNILDQHLGDLPPTLKEDLDTHFAGVLAVIRTSRNEAGHPTGKLITREQTYILLQLFVGYCRKMYDLRKFFLQE